MNCICGHPESSHYTYIRNGEDAVRCKDCDPTTGITATNVEISGLSALMYRASDHEFTLGPPKYELWDVAVGICIGIFLIPEQVTWILSHYENDIPTDYALSIDGKVSISGPELLAWYREQKG